MVDEGCNDNVQEQQQCDQFDVKKEAHQSFFFLSPLLFIVLEALLRECRSTLAWEMWHVDDLVIITERLEELDTRYASWKYCMEGKVLRMNLAQTKCDDQ